MKNLNMKKIMLTKFLLTVIAAPALLCIAASNYAYAAAPTKVTLTMTVRQDRIGGRTKLRITVKANLNKTPRGKCSLTLNGDLRAVGDDTGTFFRIFTKTTTGRSNIYSGFVNPVGTEDEHQQLSVQGLLTCTREGVTDLASDPVAKVVTCDNNAVTSTAFITQLKRNLK